MIKDFETYITEGRLQRIMNAAKNDEGRKEDKLTEEIVRSYIYIEDDRDYYNSICEKVNIRKENGQSIVDIIGSYVIKREITELPFRFGKVTESFSTRYCDKLTSLNGCPKYVGGNFVIEDCTGLKEIDDLPEYVGGNFFCDSFGGKYTEDEIRKRCTIKGLVNIQN